MKQTFHYITTIFIIGYLCANGQNAPTAARSQYQHSGNHQDRGNGIHFTQNKGQIVDMKGNPRPDILFKSDNTNIYLRKTGISYVLSNVGKLLHEVEEQVEEKERSGEIQNHQEHLLKEQLIQKEVATLHRVDVDFINCNPNPQIQTSEPVEGFTNYYYSYCPEGITNVNSYNRVVVKNIYNNIDIIYYGGGSQGLKYDIVVNPGGDPNDIKLKYIAADKIEINPSTGSGDKLIIKNSISEITEQLPKVYQNINGEIVDIKTEYKLEHLPGGETIVLFSFSIFNSSFPLVIDPWASYYGGFVADRGTGVTTDPSGNVVFCGQTTSSNFPVTAGAFQVALSSAGKNDAFVVKMTSAGARLWATYYGGSTSEDKAHGIATDASGNIFVVGETQSTNFPVGASAGNSVNQTIYGGGGVSTDTYVKGDAFLVALNTSGARLWATYYGGSSDDIGMGVTTDGSNIYISGTTFSGNAIANGSAFQSAVNGTGTVSTTLGDAFAVKFSPTGAVAWGTYVGGSGADRGSGIDCDLAGNIYLAGGTSSTNFPVSGGCHQPAYGGTGTGGDAFLFKFNPAGARLWATYYGGTFGTMSAGSFLPTNVVTDGLNNVIIAVTLAPGATPGAINDGSATVGAYQEFITGTSGAGNMFEVNLVKFNSAGARQWGTYLGGNGPEYVFSIATDATNNIYVYGEWEDSDSKNYPISSCAYQSVFGGSEDVYIAKYDPNGRQLCITYMGGNREDDLDLGGPNEIVVDGNVLYITGYTGGGFPVTVGAFQTAYAAGPSTIAGESNAFIAQLCINICEGKNLIINPNANAVTCPGTPVNFTPNVNNSCDTSGYKYKWIFTGGTPATSTLTKPSVTYSAPGYYDIKLVVTTPCKKDSVTKTNYIIVNPCTINANATGATLCSASNCANIIATGSSGTSPYTYSWNTGATTSTINVCPPIGTTVYTVMVTDAAGNYAATTTSVTVNQSPVLRTNSYNITCTQSGQAYVDSVNGLSSSKGTSGQIPWNYQFNWSNNSTWFSHNGLAAGGYTVSVTDLSNGCTTTKTFNITGSGAASATFTSSTACIGSLVNFTNTGSSGTGVTHSWYIGAPVNTSGTTTNFSYTFLTAGSYNVDHTVTNAGCTNKVTNVITVINCNGPTAVATGSSVCPGSCAVVSSGGTGGTTPYTYTWSNGATTQNINPCPATTTAYTVTIKDSGGNISTSTAIVTINPAINATATSTNITCNGSTNGSVLANLTGGTSPFVYTWSNGQTSQTITGLAPGNYSVTVADSKGCTATFTSAVISPPPLLGQFTKGSASCNGCGCKEWILLNAAGGTSPYSYTWPDGYIYRYKNQLCPGTYSINIKDKNGCSANINLTAP